jgi:hypothetical protein
MIESAVAAAEVQVEQLLTDLVMNCPELTELEAALSRFNIFRVLRADKHEIRHSNMLAWLFDPEESHGLGDRFLRRWLMRVLYDANTAAISSEALPSPIEVDAADIDFVDVARERDNIDVLILIHTGQERYWAVCIENKVESLQHSSQLARYREIVTKRHHDAQYRVFVFLAKNGEQAEEESYLCTSYEVIASVLRECLSERESAIGAAPRLLVEQYLELLEDDFVDDSKTAQLARQIYHRHRRAIDYILENISDTRSEASAIMEEVLSALAAEAGIRMCASNKGTVRFLPKEWDVPQNTGGTAWGKNSRFLFCAVTFWTRNIELHVTVAKAPEDWADRVWERAAVAPLKQEWKKRPRKYIKTYKARSDIPVESLSDTDPEDLRTRLRDWITDELKKPKFREVITVFVDLLKHLRTT